MAAGKHGQRVNDDLVLNLFHAAMSRPEEERGEFVRQACQGQPDLLAEVERRVQWEVRLKGFLLKPVALPTATTETLTEPGGHVDYPFEAGELLLERFLIVRVAGEGGMGVVYEAIDQRLQRRIALKCPRFEFRKRISAEAVKAICITHPNVCRVFEVHTVKRETGDIDFLTMEFLDGETLALRLKKAPPRWLESDGGMEIARQICAGLKAVHREGVIHRDLKPGNIMISTDAAGKPRAVLMDFGIAQATEIFTGEMRGTPAYIAPEVWRGQPATEQTDLFALGVILYQMGTGQVPFPEKTPWHVRLNEAPATPRIAEPQRSAVMRCLDPDVRRRIKDVDQLEAALRRRYPRRWILGGAATVLALGLAGVAAWERFPGTTPAAANRSEVYANEYEAYRSARRLLDRYDKKNNIDRAIEALQAAVRLNRNYALAYAGLSEAYLRRNAKPDAEAQRKIQEAADMAVLLNPDLAAAHTARGMALAVSPDRSAAASEFRKALDLDPKSSGAYLGLAKLAQDEKEAEAEEAFQKSIQLASGEWLPLGEYARFLFNSARFHEAAETWERALAIAPDNVRVLRALGSVYQKLDRDADAASMFQRVLEIEPDAGVYTDLGTCLYYVGRYAEAAAEMQKAVDMDPPRQSVYWGNLGDAYRWAPGQRSRSIEPYRKAIALVREEIRAAPADSVLRASLATYLAKSGDHAGAAAALVELGGLAKVTAYAQFQAAIVFEVLGNRESALHALADALRQGHPVREVRNDPELAALRADPHFRSLQDRFAGAGEPQPARP